MTPDQLGIVTYHDYARGKRGQADRRNGKHTGFGVRLDDSIARAGTAEIKPGPGMVHTQRQGTARRYSAFGLLFSKVYVSFFAKRESLNPLSTFIFNMNNSSVRGEAQFNLVGLEGSTSIGSGP
jgi:hypothetical protein